MRFKKSVLFLGTVVLVIGMVVGCGSSDGGGDQKPLSDNEGFTGSVFSTILKGLAEGMLRETGSDIMGNFLAILGWGDSGNSDEEQTLNHIDDELTKISGEFSTIETELQNVLRTINVSEDSIKDDVNWPRDAKNQIDAATQDLQLMKTGPGEGNVTEIQDRANEILGTQYAIKTQVIAISNAIEGNPTPLFSNYVNKAVLQLPYNDDDKLQSAYQAFEYYTTQLMNIQILGVNLVVEAYKGLDNNASAQEYLNCYNSDVNLSECNILYSEIGDMNNSASFIYNAVSLVLNEAPIYDPFLPASAVSILKRAEYYRLLMTGTEGKDFGLRFFYISTADMNASPDELYAQIPGYGTVCKPTRYVIAGRPYDFWTGDTVKPSTDYNVVEYNCGSVPSTGTYQIYGADFTPLGTTEVSQYGTNYDLNASGAIRYGFTILTNNIANRFPESSSNWTVQKPSKENYHSSTSGSANSWPIKGTVTTDGENEGNAHIELDGHFHYDVDAPEQTMYVDYHAEFYTKADAPFYNSTGGGDAYSYYYVGVYDDTVGDYASDACKDKTYYRLHASSTHSYSGHHDVSDYCSFTAKPGHHYYVYFKMVANALAPNDSTVAESELDTVYRVYVMATH